MTTELLPCPFCGGEASLLNGTETATDCAVYKVYCRGCQVRQFSHPSMDGAIADWNRRASVAASPEPVRESVADGPRCARCDDTGCPKCDPEWAAHQRRLTPEEAAIVDRALLRSAKVVARGQKVAATPVEPQSPGVPRVHAEQCGFHVGLPCICAVGDPAHDARPQEGALGGQGEGK